MPVNASLAQVRAGKDGKLIEFDGDVFDVVARIKEVSPSLTVKYHDGLELYRIGEIGDDGRDRLVKWVVELTPDLPDYLRRLGKSDYIKTIDQQDAKAERDLDHRLAEQRGPLHEKLAHAVRKDVGYTGKIFVPRWP